MMLTKSRDPAQSKVKPMTDEALALFTLLFHEWFMFHDKI